MWTRSKLIGWGSFGEVYMAETCNDGSHYLPPVMAVKSSPISESNTLREEYELLKLFEDCPHILNSFGNDVTKENGEELYNLHLEYASGGSLSDALSMPSGRRGLEEADVRYYTRSILMGLHHIHRLGYVHCDIKPDNLLLFGDNKAKKTVKIADFGLTKRVEKKFDRATILGTLMYVAPESIIDNNYETGVDIWALGCTVLQLLTGENPWPVSDKLHLIRKIGFEDWTPLIPTRLSKEAQDFLRKCLIREPELRWNADMLLAHPFASTILEERGHEYFLVPQHQCRVNEVMYHDVLIGF